MINDYDKFAKERQEQLKKGEKRPHRFIEKPMMRELMPNLERKKVLMLGCGSGEESLMLEEFNATNIVGIDLSEESIRLAKESYPNCEFIVGDMHKLPFEDNTFDFVYSSLAIHYSSNPENVFNEINRILKDNGQLLFSVGHPLRWACEEKEIDGIKCRVIAHGVDNDNDIQIGNYNTFKKHDHYFNNGEVLSFYVGSPSYYFKTLKKSNFIVEDFREGICTDDCKDIDYNYWNKYHEIPQFMSFIVTKKQKELNMKLLVICSKNFYSEIENVKSKLEERNIEVFLPNCYDEPDTEQKMWELGKEKHQEFKAKMYKQSEEVISNMDAVLVLNLDKEKNGQVLENYIGGATFLEMYDAFRLGKKIYLYNNIPAGMLYDEIEGFNPIIINKNLDKI